MDNHEFVVDSSIIWRDDVNKFISPKHSFHLPPSSKEALAFIEQLKESVLAQFNFEQGKVPEYDLSLGTYIKEARFDKDGTVTFMYNEGTEEVVEISPEGHVSIGEKKYDILPSIKHSQRLVTEFHHSGMAKCSSKSNWLHVPASDILEAIYYDFPKVRIECPDMLYNVRDYHQLATRSEVFDSFIRSSLKDIFTRVPDKENICIFLLEPTTKGVHSVMEIMSIVNGTRQFPLLFSDGLGSYVRTGCSYYYYLVNPFSHISSFKKDMVFQIDKPILDYDEIISDELDRILGNSDLNSNCSVICLSYKPSIFIAYGSYDYGVPEDYYVNMPKTYDVGNTLVCPHKPWSLMCISSKRDCMHVPGNFSTAHNPRTVYKAIMGELYAICYVNVERNWRLGDDRSRAEFSQESYESALLWFRECCAKSTITRRYDSYIRFKSKSLHTNCPSLRESVDMAYMMGKLDYDRWYTSDFLHKEGWSKDMISRAVRVGILLVSKDSTYFSYKKRGLDPSVAAVWEDIQVSVDSNPVVLLPTGEVIGGTGSFDGTVFVQTPVVVERHTLSAGGLYSNYVKRKPIRSSDVRSSLGPRSSKSGRSGGVRSVKKKPPNNDRNKDSVSSRFNKRKPKWKKKSSFSASVVEVRSVKPLPTDNIPPDKKGLSRIGRVTRGMEGEDDWARDDT